MEGNSVPGWVVSSVCWEGQQTRDEDNWGPGPPLWFISESLGSSESTHAWTLPHLIKSGSLGSGLLTGESVSS